MNTSTELLAEFISAADLERKISQNIEAKQANEILREAQLKAENLTKVAERSSSKRRSYLESIAKRSLSKNMVEKQKVASTLAVREILATTAKVHGKFDALAPWISDLVEQSVRKIIGEIPKEVAYKKIITLALSQRRTDLSYSLRTGPDGYEAGCNLLKDLQKTPLKNVIKDVQVDDKLPPDSCVLTSSAGAFDVSLETQLQSLHAELRTSLEADDGNE
jgi:flagellar biosynthesis/type III secretory pathway protein FliH